MQRKIYTVKDFDEMAKSLSEVDSNYSLSYFSGYDFNVMALALERLDMAWNWVDPRNIQDLDLDLLTGVIVNIKKRSFLFFKSRHWFCIIKLGSSFYKIDSMDSKPFEYEDKEACLKDLVYFIEQCEAELIAVTLKMY